MPVLRLDDGDVYYSLTGRRNAPVVLLLHGLGSSADDWALQTVALVDRYRVLTIDLPGHHRSSRPRARLSVPRMAQAVVQVLDAIGVDDVHAAGLSLGGCVALALAVESAARVRSLVLVNTFARLRPSGPRGVVRTVVRVLLAVGAPMSVQARFLARDLFPRTDQLSLREAAIVRLASNSRRHYLSCLAAIAAFDVTGRLGHIACPTLVLAGARDTTVPLSAKELLARAIPSARLCIVDDSGHAVPYDRPGRFNEIMLEHLDRVESARSRSVDKPKRLPQYR